MRFLIVTFLVGLLGSALAAADPSAEPGLAAPREVYVPADQPSVWPAGRWLARPTAEYRRMLANFANPPLAPPRAMLRRAIYTATFSHNSLDGRFRAEVAVRGSEPAFLSLGQAALALHELTWQDDPAVWGLTPNGDHVVRVRSDATLLEGRWSLRGRELFGRIEFDVTLPPAVISTLELRLPAALQLWVDEHVAVQVVPDSNSRWRTWIVNLGRENQLHVTIADEADRPAPSWAMVERESHYSLLPDGLSLEAVFQFDNLSEDTDRVRFTGTSGLEVTSVVVGTERELPFQRSQDEQGVLIHVPAKSLSGRGRVSLRVLCKVPLPDEGTWTLPRISLDATTPPQIATGPRKAGARSEGRVSGAVERPVIADPDVHNAQSPPEEHGRLIEDQKPFELLSSRSYVTVHRPLELRDFSVIDCRLISSTIVRQQSDRLEFEDWSDNSQITVTWDVPQADLIADVITAVGGDDLQPTFRTLLQLTTRSGSTYELSCRIPRNWQVTQVTSQPWHPSQKISSWLTETPEDGPAELLLEFRDALKPGDPVFIEVEASGLSGEESPSTWLAPQVTELGRVHLVIQPTAKRQVHVPPTSSFRPTHAARVRELWSHAIGDWDQWRRESFGRTPASREPLYFVAEHPSKLDVALVPTDEPALSPQNTDQREGWDASSRKTGALPAADSQQASGNRRPARRTLTADVTIHTRVPAAPRQPALQTARYLIQGTGSGAELTFELTPPGELISASLDGSDERVALMARTVHLDMPAGVERRLVEIHYRTPFSQSFLWGTGEIPLPRSALAVTNLQWQIEVPDSTRLQPWTDGTSFRPLPFGWRERLLGPLARESALHVRQPRHASAEQPLQPERRTSPENASSTVDAPSSILSETGDAIHRRSLPFTAQTLRLGIWKQDNAQHVGWVLLVVAFLTIAFAGRLPSRGCFTIKSAAVAATALTAIVVPESLIVPCGGLFLGALLGAIFPQQILSRHDARDVDPRSLGSTRIIARAFPSVLLLALGVSNTMHAFQLDYTPTSPLTTTPQVVTPPSDELSYEAMIPVHSGRPTLEETPVVYVRPSLLERWHALTQTRTDSPPYLLRTAQYIVSGPLQTVPRVAAIFDVLLLDATATDRIALPLTGIAIDGDAACRVNGQTASVIPLQGDLGIVVELPSAVKTGEHGDRRSPQVSHHERAVRIELAFRPDAADRRPRRRLQFSIPPVFASTAEVRDNSDDGGKTLVNGFGRTTVSTPDGHVLAELGPVRRLEIGEDDALSTSGEAVLVPDLALSSIELHPRHLSVRTRLRFRVGDPVSAQSPSVLEVLLPAKAAVTEVKALSLISSHVRRVAGESTKLQLAFAELTADHVEVEVALTLPGAALGNTSVIPALPFFDAIASPSPARQMVAITPSSGFRVAEAASEFLGEWLTPASASQFQQLWDVSGSVNPVLVFSLTNPRSFPLEVTPIQPIREASVIETLACERSQFPWKADVELECRGAPVAVHKFHIDPRVQITSVRIVQEGLERHIRWFRRDGPELTILLSDDLVGSQSIALAGNLPAVLNQTVEIPRLKIPGFALLQHEVRLQRPRGWTVEVFDEDGTLLAARPEHVAPANQTVTGERIQSFDLHAAPSPLQIRVSENASPFQFERIVSLHAWDADQVRMRMLFRLGERRPLPPHIEFIVPAEWTRYSPLTTEPALSLDHTREDGSAVYGLDTRNQIPPPEYVEFAATIPSPAPVDGEWTISTIEAVGGSPTRERLVLSGETRFDVAGAASVQSEPLDGELLQTIRLPDESESHPRRAFASSRSEWTILPTPRFSAKGHVRRMESSLWDVPHFGVVGITSALVTLHLPDAVIVDVPSELQLVLAMWDDVPISLPAEDRSSLTVPAPLISSPSSPHHLRLWWKRACPRLQIRRTIPLPRIRDLPVIGESVALLGSERTLYEVGASWKPVPEGAWPTSTSATEPPEGPVEAALKAAGIPDRAQQTLAPVHLSPAILKGQIEPDAQRAHSEVTLWRLRRDWQRGVLAVLLSALLVMVWCKTKSRAIVRPRKDHREIRTFGGMLFVSILLWTMGPPLLGFGLFVLVSVVWAGSAWHRRHADSTFDMDSEFA